MRQETMQSERVGLWLRESLSHPKEGRDAQI